jgi:hypothetical protein
MRNFESKLKRLRLLAPSEQLDERVLGVRPERAEGPSRAPRRIPLWSAAAVSLIMGSLGFVGGAICQSRRLPGTAEMRTPIRVELICDSPSGTNPFDFTTVSDDLQDTDWKVKVIKGKEQLT